jgi:CRP-like cAMP-binding protein
MWTELDGTFGQRRLKIAAGETIYKMGDSASALFFVESGLAKISRCAPYHREFVIGLRSRGDFFGVAALLTTDYRRTKAIALADCVVIEIEKAALLTLLRTAPDFSEALTIFLAKQHARDQELLLEQTLACEADWHIGPSPSSSAASDCA